MDDIQKRLTQMLEEWPDCVDDRRQFRSLLQDYIPQNKLQANLLLNAYDEDVVTQLKSCSDVTLHALQLAKSLSDNYGVTKESAIWSVVTWCYMLRQNKIAESIEGTFPIVPSTSTADIIQQTTPKKKMKLGCGMYLAGVDIPTGDFKMESVEKNSPVYLFIYTDLTSSKCVHNERFMIQAYSTIERGQLMKVNEPVLISFI